MRVESLTASEYHDREDRAEYENRPIEFEIYVAKYERIGVFYQPVNVAESASISPSQCEEISRSGNVPDESSIGSPPFDKGYSLCMITDQSAVVLVTIDSIEESSEAVSLVVKKWTVEDNG